jgi:phosphonate transport system substrate-binding protein
VENKMAFDAQYIKKISGFSIVAFILILLSLYGCQGKNTAEQTTTPTLTPTPTITPTPIPLGSSGNPVIISVVSETNMPSVTQGIEDLSSRLANQTGYAVTSKVYPSYQSLLKDMEANKVQITWLPALTYIAAKEKGIAEVAFLSNHFGVTQYGFQYFANATGGYRTYYDPLKNENTADQTTALKQFENKRPCWVEPESASGYFLPLSMLKENNIAVLPGVLSQSHTAVIRALYIGGICDFGATFAISGDPRTASNVQQDLPDVMDRVVVIWKSPPVIPNINITYSSSLPREMSQKFNDAFLDLIKTDEGKSVMTTALNYDVQDLKIVDDSVYDPLRKALYIVNALPALLIGK